MSDSDAERDAWMPLLEARLRDADKAEQLEVLDQVGRVLLAAVLGRRPAGSETPGFRRFRPVLREMEDERDEDLINSGKVTGPRSRRPTQDELLKRLMTADWAERGAAAVELMRANPGYLLSPLVAQCLVEWHRRVRQDRHGVRPEQKKTTTHPDAARDFLREACVALMRGGPPGGRGGRRVDLEDFRYAVLTAKFQVVLALGVVEERAQGQRAFDVLATHKLGHVAALLLGEPPNLKHAIYELLAARYNAEPATIKKWCDRLAAHDRARRPVAAEEKTGE